MDAVLFFPVIIFDSVALQSLIIWCATGLGTIALIGAVFFVLFHTDTYSHKDNPILMAKLKLIELVTVFGSVFLSWALVVFLKSVIAAPRPFLYFNSLNPLFSYGGYDSFPSGHATFFAALATSLYFYHPRMGSVYFILALVIGSARVLARIHFPIDIIAGFALGILITTALHYMLNKSSSVKK
ncbi:MAG: hypothetical protein QG669_131 [Patescibacteria group bacterium]|jgi:membrane-associated phospholipid phosphatase|nr:hypothetical protein [Patescibacteria group bacterium]